MLKKLALYLSIIFAISHSLQASDDIAANPAVKPSIFNWSLPASAVFDDTPATAHEKKMGFDPSNTPTFVDQPLSKEAARLKRFFEKKRRHLTKER